MCEVFNRQLVGGRDKPIITALEFCREYLMKRLVIVQKVIDKSPGPLTPTATKLLERNKREASQYVVLWNGEHDYQVKLFIVLKLCMLQLCRMCFSKLLIKDVFYILR